MCVLSTLGFCSCPTCVCHSNQTVFIIRLSLQSIPASSFFLVILEAFLDSVMKLSTLFIIFVHNYLHFWVVFPESSKFSHKFPVHNDRIDFGVVKNMIYLISI